MTKLKFYTLISLQIIALGTILFLGTYLSDYLRSSGIFGDVKLPIEKTGWSNGDGPFVSDGYDWGFRHYVYSWTIIALFLVQAYRIWTFIDEKL